MLKKIQLLLGLLRQTFLRWFDPEEKRKSSPSFFGGIFLIILGFVLLISSLVSKPAPSFPFLFLLILLVLLNLIFPLAESFFKTGVQIASILINLLLLTGLIHLASTFSPKLALNLSLAYLIFPLSATFSLSPGGVFFLSGGIVFLLTLHLLATGALFSNLAYLFLFSLILGALTVLLYFFRHGISSKESLNGKILASNLTPREKDILLLLGEGKANKEIAFSLGISEKTVRNELSLIYRKLNVASRQEALLKFL